MKAFALFAVSLFLGQGAATVQYCHANPVDYCDFCVAVNAHHNETAGADDLHVTISAKFHNEKAGWLGIGAGSYLMHHALMFVMYPGIDTEKAIIGVRSTQYHSMPRHSPDLPTLSVMDRSFDGTYHSISFVCHECSLWNGGVLQSESAPWIWAVSPYAPADSDNPDKHLGIHEVYGGFFMEMQSARTAEASFPRIDTRVSIGATEKRKSTASNPFIVHGALLAGAFGILYPAGAAMLSVDVAKHGWLQGGTLLLAQAGVGLGLYHSIVRGGWASLLGLHQGVGCIVGVLLLLQAYLGWSNHAHYVRTHVSSTLRPYHVGLGRGLYVAGAGNAVLGLAAASGPSWAAAWFALVVCELAGYSWYKRAFASKHRYEPVAEEAESKVESEYD